MMLPYLAVIIANDWRCIVGGEAPHDRIRSSVSAEERKLHAVREYGVTITRCVADKKYAGLRKG